MNEIESVYIDQIISILNYEFHFNDSQKDIVSQELVKVLNFGKNRGHIEQLLLQIEKLTKEIK